MHNETWYQLPNPNSKLSQLLVQPISSSIRSLALLSDKTWLPKATTLERACHGLNLKPNL
jgi:hypothetical protein